MNKQQLAAKIWESTNQMRSKIEANEYKDYILGFIFYKYLSDQLLSFAKAQGMSEDEIKALSEDDPDTVAYIKKKLGYFIAYNDLFSTWLDAGSDFDVSNVRDVLSAFSRLIHNDHKKLFDGFFDTLQTGLSKLTRMNLVMRGILPNNIVTRNGDTLEEDWPYFDAGDLRRQPFPLPIIPWMPLSALPDCTISTIVALSTGNAP